MFSSKPYNTMKSRVLYHLCVSASAELNKASESIAAAFKVFDKEKDNKIETMDAIIREYRNGLEDILANFKDICTQEEYAFSEADDYGAVQSISAIEQVITHFSSDINSLDKEPLTSNDAILLQADKIKMFDKIFIPCDDAQYAAPMEYSFCYVDCGDAHYLVSPISVANDRLTALTPEDNS